jgi:hypothetical protein
MLNYTTTTIVNSDNSIDAVSGLFRIKFGPELKKDANHTPVLVSKKAYTAATLAKATVILPGTEGIYRIAMYIRLRNNNNPYFSNAWTFKGKPIYVEFNGGDSAATVISRAKKYMLAQYGYNLVDFENTAKYTAEQAAAYNATLTGAVKAGDSDGNSGTYTESTAATHNATLTGAVDTDDVNPNALSIVAHDQWEIFMDQDSNKGVIVETLKTVDTAGNIVNGSTTLPTHEEFVAEASNNTSDVVSVNNGNEAFGDFAHIVKDLRLPTDANRRWQGIAEGDVFGGEPNDDKPLPTGKYTQYTIQYSSERGVLQQTALGGVATSRTVHVFYVESAAVSKFETALSTSTIADSAAVSNAATAASTMKSNVIGAKLI